MGQRIVSGGTTCRARSHCHFVLSLRTVIILVSRGKRWHSKLGMNFDCADSYAFSLLMRIVLYSLTRQVVFLLHSDKAVREECLRSDVYRVFMPRTCGQDQDVDPPPRLPYHTLLSISPKSSSHPRCTVQIPDFHSMSEQQAHAFILVPNFSCPLSFLSLAKIQHSWLGRRDC